MFEDVGKFKVWQESHSLVCQVYEVTKRFPASEVYGLQSQMRRAAVSVPSNIVEGKARNSNKDYLRFLYISRGSLEELKYQTFLSKDLSYISEKEYSQLDQQLALIGKLLNGLIKSLQS